MIKIDNKIVVDLNKAQHAKLFYMNQHGQLRSDKLPKNTFSVHGVVRDDNAVMYRPLNNMTAVSMKALAISNNSIDVWKPVVRFEMSANHRLFYSGQKAIDLYGVWCQKIYSKKKQINETNKRTNPSND